MHRILATPVGAAAAALALFLAPAGVSAQGVDRGTHGVVELETQSPDGTSGAIVGELAALLDDGATRRVLPVLGEGAMQNIVDLKSLKGIDLALVQADALDAARQQKLAPGIESIAYVARLYSEEFHLLARADVKTIADLAGKKVNVGPAAGGTVVTAGKVFAALGIAVTPLNDATGVALAKLAKGDIDAVALVAAKPAPLVRALDAASGIHLLSIPLKGPVAAAYAPTRFVAKDYPGLVAPDAAIDTVAVGTVLLAANLAQGSERQRNVANFVEALFTQFPTLLEPGHNAKWQDVNLAAELPGWHRYPAAEQWLARNATVAQKAPPQDMKVVFERFLDERLKLMGTPMSQQQKDDLFAQFEHWQDQGQTQAAGTTH